MVSSFSESMVIVYCEDCGIPGRMGFFGIVAEILPGEAREFLEGLFHGASEVYLVELSPVQGVRAACCTGRLEITFSIETIMKADPHRYGPLGGYGVTIRMGGANV